MAAKVPTTVKQCKTCLACKGLYEVKSVCKECQVCRNCGCQCRKCPLCKTLTPVSKKDRWCSHCSMCSKCDQCRNMPHFVHPTKLRIQPSKSYLNKLPRPLGIELEISDWKGINGERFKNFSFQQAHDASVVPSGLEMVMTPMVGDNFLRGMVELSKSLMFRGSEINETCALHVHVNGSDLSYWELRRLLIIYAQLEGEIYDFLIAPHRRDEPNVVHYCQMLTRKHVRCAKCERYDTQYPGTREEREAFSKVMARLNAAKTTADIKAIILRMLYNIDNPLNQPSNLQARKGGRYAWCRYVGLNLHAWQYRGTVEWRMKEATTDLVELVMWPLFCGWATHATTRMNDHAARSIKSLSSFCHEYMPKMVAAWVDKKIEERKKGR